MSKIHEQYYIGNPEAPRKRGKDKHGQVHCLCWLLIYAKGVFFAKPNEYSLSVGGGGLGRVTSLKEGRAELARYALQDLQQQQKVAADKLSRIGRAIQELEEHGLKYFKDTTTQK